jgi:hypothetical protein
MSVQFVPYLNQDFEKLKSKHLKENRLFVDDKFPANSNSLYRFSTRNGTVKWKRPSEICSNPQFIVNKIEPDVIFLKFNFRISCLCPQKFFLIKIKHYTPIYYFKSIISNIFLFKK